MANIINNDIDLEPGLYLVATPIGNLRDITLRALDVLNAADMVFCEDTRVSRKLFNAYNIKQSLKSYHDHSPQSSRDGILSVIEAGKSVALISDAGMPCISDPGYKLVHQCRERGYNVWPIPGANAPLAALSASGFATDRFHFCGFLPPKKNTRREVLEPLNFIPATIILFETGNKLIKTLTDIQMIMGRRHVVIAREITKKFEEFKTGYTDELVNRFNKEGAPKGEIVVLISSNTNKTDKAINADEVDALLLKQLASHTLKDAVQSVSDMTGMKKKVVYARALFLKGGV